MPIVPVCTHKYRDFRDKIPDGINPLRNSEPLIYVPSADGPGPLTSIYVLYSATTVLYLYFVNYSYIVPYVHLYFPTTQIGLGIQMLP